MSNNPATRPATLRRLVAVAVATVAAGSIAAVVLSGTASGERQAGAASSADSPGTSVTPDVQARPGECINRIGAGLLNDPVTDGPRSPAAAFAQAQEMDPELGRLTPLPGDPTRAEHIESGRRVSAVQVRGFPLQGSGTAWYSVGAAYSAPCGYVPQRDIDSANTAYPGITPGVPRTGDWRPSGPPPPPPDE